MSRVTTFEFNTDQMQDAITKRLRAYGFDAQVVKIPTEAKEKKRKRKEGRIFPVAKSYKRDKMWEESVVRSEYPSHKLFPQPVSMNQKQYLLYLAEHDYRGEVGAYLKMLVQTAKYLLEIINDEGIYYYRSDLSEEFDAENTKPIRAEEIPSYPPDMNETCPTRYFIKKS